MSTQNQTGNSNLLRRALMANRVFSASFGLLLLTAPGAPPVNATTGGEISARFPSGWKCKPNWRGYQRAASISSAKKAHMD